MLVETGSKARLEFGRRFAQSIRVLESFLVDVLLKSLTVDMELQDLHFSILRTFCPRGRFLVLGLGSSGREVRG